MKSIYSNHIGLTLHLNYLSQIYNMQACEVRYLIYSFFYGYKFNVFLEIHLFIIEFIFTDLSVLK